MCEDRHVSDFLQCLQCWLWRSYGDSRVTGRPWRLRRLDLAQNSLSDESICAVLGTMKRLDVRVERVFLSGNCMRAAGMAAVTEYVWNCQEALMELDISDNEVAANASSSMSGGDSVSALIRCLYNHPSYPMMLDSGHEGRKVIPFLLRFGGNFIDQPERLLEDILSRASKGGKTLIRICDSQESHLQGGDEFLSIYMPDFPSQRAVTGSMPTIEATVVEDPSGSGRTLERSRSRRVHSSKARRRRHRRTATPAAAASEALLLVSSGHEGKPETEVALPATGPAQTRLVQEEGSGVKEPAEDVPAGTERRRRKSKEAHVKAELTDAAASLPQRNANGQKETSPPLLTEEEQHKLQGEVEKKLAKIEGLPSEQSTREMLSEFTVCMLVARKGPQEVEAELASFLGQEHAVPVAAWFMKHVRSRYKNAARGAGW
ncbi:unnamed protein product [Polarella glacialis]|uniref:Uncharacterized protein n=2 Tax=Polarella glacialis TaxID=89957 RepID=A0A813FTK4_POLGL|nr:unnamed protein product [Polarella glacialis]